jgi:hypothetical protein
MDQIEFESRFSLIAEKIKGPDLFYNFRGNNIWENVGSLSRDIFFTEFAELYIDADAPQRKQISDYFAAHSLINDLYLYVRRIGKLIQSEQDSRWLQIGIAAAMIDGGRGDYRDLIVSLVLLRFAAEIQGIDPLPFFDDSIQNADEKMRSILTNARDHKESDIHFSVQNSGNPDWVAESKRKYGEHPIYTQLKSKLEKNSESADKKEKKKGFWSLFR